jgi:hypothetical protein
VLQALGFLKCNFGKSKWATKMSPHNQKKEKEKPKRALTQSEKKATAQHLAVQLNSPWR